MAATSRGLVVSSALQGRFIANLNRSRSSRWSSSLGTRGFVMPTSKSFRAFRTIKKSPRLNRSSSRVFTRFSATPSAMLGDNYFMSKKDTQQDDVMKTFANDDDDAGVAVDEDDSNPAMVDSLNAVLADIVDGQKYRKETGRTKARPMKRRALVVSLALGALRDPLNSVDSRLGSLRRTPTARLTRTPSASGFAHTAQLISQLSFGSPHGN